MTETPHLTQLKRVGAVLLAVGVLDIAYLIYCVATGINYSSSFNIFAVIAGALLVRGSLRAASAVRWFGTFMLAAIAATALAWPLIQPLDLTITQVRLAPLQALASLGFLAFLVALLGWVCTRLGSAEILAARSAAGRKSRDLRIPAVAGVGLVLAMAALIPLPLKGESGAKAKELAQQQLGDGYRYHVSSIRVSTNSDGTFVASTVTAWNEREVKVVPLQWRE